jgi:hypothetical protein
MCADAVFQSEDVNVAPSAPFGQLLMRKLISWITSSSGQSHLGLLVIVS